MTQDKDCKQALSERIALAYTQRQPLRIHAGQSKVWFARPVSGEPVSVSDHRGILDYEPAELVITARAGTPLADIEQTLRDKQQMLGFEPPHFGEQATLGGTIACGLSGPRRAWAGSARDFLLGASIINGKGEALSFGGRVMKNVAGYDLSRLMAGALGTLGVLTELSLKVLPLPEATLTLGFTTSLDESIERCQQYTNQAVPLSASCYHDGRLYLRLSGAEASIRHSQRALGGDLIDNAEAFWQSVREQRHTFFDSQLPLWRLSVAPASKLPELDGDWLIEWGGGQRWLTSTAETSVITAAARASGGSATLFHKQAKGRSLPPLDGAVLALHRRLKQALDPAAILNPGALYESL